MATQAQTQWLESYSATPVEGLFFSRFFNFSRASLGYGTKIAFDVRKGSQQVAVPVGSDSASPFANTADGYATKDFAPPKFYESLLISNEQLASKQFGEISVSKEARDLNAVMDASVEASQALARKIVRAGELQAAQIFGGGAITTVDAAGNTVFSESFNSGAQFAAPGTLWSVAATCTPLADLEARASLITANSGCSVTDVAMGSNAWALFQNAASVKASADVRNYNILTIGQDTTPPEFLNSGAVLVGSVMLAGNRVRLWVYDRTYTSAAGVSTKYLDTNKVVLIAQDGGFKTGICLPVVSESDPRFAQYLPRDVLKEGRGGYALSPRAFPSENRDGFKVIVEARLIQVPSNASAFGSMQVA